MSDYIGRFAPSPTGPLHFGSLVAAVASYLDAKAHDGQWLVRMEDLDKPREMLGAADDILRTLEQYGFEWDGDVIYQGQRNELYQAYLDHLKQQNLIYPCGCTRKEIDAIAHAGIEGAVYPGTCRDSLAEGKTERALRVRVDVDSLSFIDRLQGVITHHMQQEIGDFVLKRADGLFAYQLAVVADDAEQGVTHVVRGADLLNSTTRQIYLQQQLGLFTPAYAHIRLVMNEAGEKLSKQTHAAPISSQDALTTLKAAMQFLGLTIDEDIDSQDALFSYAATLWSKQAKQT